MYKQLALGLALALVVTPFTAGAQEAPSTPSEQQTTKTFIVAQPCSDVAVIMQTISKYQEEPLFQTTTLSQHTSGRWFEGSSMMFVNWQTGTYSFVTLYPDGTACMQAVGTNFKPYEGDKLYTVK